MGQARRKGKGKRQRERGHVESGSMDFAPVTGHVEGYLKNGMQVHQGFEGVRSRTARTVDAGRGHD